MELSNKEKIYLKRYELGIMKKEQFKLYFTKGLITEEFYEYIMNYELK